MLKKGHKKSQKWKNKISEGLEGNTNRLGKKHTQGTIGKISASMMGKNKGKKRTQKIKSEISARLIGNTNGFQKGVNHKGGANPGWKGGFRFDQRRGYGHHKISFEHPGCVWHHVNMMFVVACPKEIHLKCNHHVLGTGKSAGIHAHFLEGVLG